MRIKTVRNWFAICCCVLAISFMISCQKEITGAVAVGCKVQQWASLNANGGIAYRFSYSYDSATGRATQLVYTDSLGLQTTVIPTYKGDTVFFSNSSYAVLDGSKRIKHLVEKSGVSPNGDYYYEYDASSHLVKSTYDDGANSFISNATFTGDALTKVTYPYNAVPDVYAFTYTYSDSVKVLGYNYFMMVDRVFPELEFYLPCFNTGVFTTKAIIKEDFSVVVPVTTQTSYSISFNNYVLTGQGYINSLSATLTYSGATYPLGGINANYLCR